MLIADECKLWDFEKPKNGVSDTGAQMVLISWNGGTEQQCRRVREDIAARIKKRRDEVKVYASAARERADQASKEWLNAAGPQKDATAKNRDAKAQEAKKFEEQSRAADRDDFEFSLALIGHGCACVQRGESEIERQARLNREQRLTEIKKREQERKAAELKLQQENEAAQKAYEDARKRAEEAKTAAEKRAAAEDVERAAKRQGDAQLAVRRYIANAVRFPPDPKDSPQFNTSSPPDSAGGVAPGANGPAILGEIREPFGDKPASSSGRSSDGLAGDPFPQGPTIRAPKGRPHQDPDSVEEGISSEIAEAVTGKLQDIAKESAREGSTSASAFRGLGLFFKLSGYGAKILEASNAETQEKRNKALGEMGLDVAMDLGEALFGNLAIAVRASRPEWEGTDPISVIRDPSRHYSHADKQEALRQMYENFDRDGSAWDGRKMKELFDLTEIVEKERARK
jgi:hypothetical protein